MKLCGSVNHPNNSVIVTLQCQTLHQILKQSVATCNTIGVLYDTVGVLITVLLLPLKSLFQFRNLNILFGINFSGAPLL